MSFSLHVACDILQQKVNLEIPFQTKPQLDLLRRTIEEVFAREHALLQQPQQQQQQQQPARFEIGRVQIYDDDAAQWVDLVSAAQLHPFDQLYAFPLDLSHICQQRRELPPPRQVPLPQSAAPRSTSGVDNGVYRSTSGQQDTSGMHISGRILPVRQSTSVHGMNASAAGSTLGGVQSGYTATQEEKLRQVFAMTDVNGNGSITPKDLGLILQHYGILFSHSVVSEMFAAVTDTQPHWNFIDFTQWTKMYPVTFSSLYQRIFLSRKDEEMVAAQKAKESSVMALEERVAELRRLLHDAEANLVSEKNAVSVIIDDLNVMRQRRAMDEEEEQAVLNKEVSVQHQRALLRREEADFEVMAQRRGLQAQASTANAHAAAMMNSNVSGRYNGF